MATQNSSNQDYTNNADGFSLSGGNTKRKITVTGGDVSLSGSSTPKTYNFPNQNGTVALLEMIYPVGSVYFNLSDSTNPATLFGFGTWVALEGLSIAGRSNTAGSTFNVAAGTLVGEEKHTMTTGELATHKHGIHGAMPVSTGVLAVNDQGGDAVLISDNVDASHPKLYNWKYNTPAEGIQNMGSSTPFNVVQPTLVGYMWKRTA